MSAHVTIQATVLQKNNEAFICNPCGGYGTNMPIPADNVQLGAEYWAVPVKTDYFQGFRYEVYTGQDAPTFDSIRCFKLTSLITSDYYYVATTIDLYSNAAAACCDSPSPSIVTTLNPIAPCQQTCTSDGTNYDAFFAVQTLADIAGGRYVATVSADGVLIKQQTFATGSTSIANLVTYLNSNASSVGTWSNIASTNTIRLRATSAKEVCFVACIKTS
jgi:hypothetical protein